MKRILILAFTVSLSACAFKGPEASRPVPVPESFLVGVKWSENQDALGSFDATGRLVAQANREFEMQGVISLPAIVPDQLNVTVELPSGVSTESAQLMGVFNYPDQSLSKPITVRRVGVSHHPQLNRPGTELSIKGLKDLIPANLEALTYLEIRMDQNLFRIGFTTPPRRVQVTQEQINAFEERSAQSISSKVKRIDSVRLRLRLLQVVSLQNTSDRKVSYKVPIHPRGELKTEMRQVDLQQGLCQFTRSEKTWEHRLSDDTFILPLTEEVAGRAEAFINEHISLGTMDVTLSPSEFAYFGIYASGQDVERFADGAFPRPKLANVEVVDSCQAWCAQNSYVYPDKTGVWKLSGASDYWKSHGSPDGARACDALQCEYTGIPATLINQPIDFAACAKCAEWEMSNGTTSWDDRRFCKGSAPGNPWNYPSNESWMLERHKAITQTGTGSSPIVLEFPLEEIGLRMSFPNTNLMGEAESSIAPFLKQTSTQEE